MKRHGAVGVLAVLSLAACHSTTATPSTTKPVSSAASPVPAPAITVADAQRALNDYSDGKNLANRTLSPALLETVEAGGLYAQSIAQMRQLPSWSARDQADYKKPFSFVAPHFIRPAGVTWWAAEATEAGTAIPKGEKDVVVFDRASGTGVWKMVADIALDEGQTIPTVPADPVAAHPDTTALRAIDDAFAADGQRAGKDLSASPATKDMHDTWAAGTWNKTLWASKIKTGRPIFPAVYALKIGDGATMAILNTNFEIANFVLRSGIKITPGKQDALYIGKKQRYEVDEEYLDQSLVVIPRAGKIDVAGTRVQMTSAHAA